MKPAPFTFVRPRSLQECLDELVDGNETTKVIAGGQSLMPLLALRMATPTRLLDIGRLPGLDGVTAGAAEIRVGALVRHARLSADPVLRRTVPLAPIAASHIGHLAIRNRGSLGGSLAHADPAAELPAIMVLHQARILCRSARRGDRLVPAAEFFHGPYLTALADDELVLGVLIRPSGPDTGHGFVEFARRDGDFARAGAAVTAGVDRRGRLTDLRAVLFAVRSAPVDVSAGFADLLGSSPRSVDVRAAAERAAQTVLSDQDTVYTARLVSTALSRSLAQAVQGVAR